MATKQSIVHILRDPLPWRPSRLTECGRLDKKGMGAPVDIALALHTKDRDLVCQACVEWQRQNRGRGATSLEREVYWSRKTRGKDHFIDLELKAIGELVARYQEEFDRLVAASALVEVAA